MNRVLKSICVLSLLLYHSCGFEFQRIPSDLTVATANLYFGNDQFDRAVKSAAALEADVLVLNETPWIEDHAEVLTSQGYRWESFRGDPRAKTTHISLAYRKDLEVLGVGVEFRTFSDEERRKAPPHLSSRAFPVIRLRVKGGSVSVIGVHMNVPFRISPEIVWSQYDLIQSAVDRGRLIRNFGAGRTGDLVIIAGDFNALPGDPKLCRFKSKGLIDCHSGDPYGINPTWNDWARIDYIFRAEELIQSFTGTWPLPGSDHRAVVAGFLIP